MAVQPKEISEHEKNLYDRQIRVWGLDAQRNLKKTKVFLLGTGSLAAETAKNLVLAGIGSLEIMSEDINAMVSKEDISSVFCFTTVELGRLKTVALTEFLKELNDNVKITKSDIDIQKVNKEYLKKFDVIVSAENTLVTQLRLNRVARELNIKFLTGDIFGRSGTCFSDLGPEFVFNQKDKEAKLKFALMEDSLMCPLELFRKRQNPQKLFFLCVKLIYVFEFQNQRLPTHKDIESLNKLLKSLNLTNSEEENLLNFLKTFVENLNSPSPAVAAIIGGILAQETIRSITKNSRPLRNWLFFGPSLKGNAFVMNLQ